MTAIRPFVVALCAGMLLAGCSFAADALWPAPDNEGDKAAKTEAASADDGKTDARKAPAPAAAQAARPSPAAGPADASAKSTLVGQKIAQLKSDLARLKSTLDAQTKEFDALRTKTRQDSENYHADVAAINARLQIGTTPGNPNLIRRWNAAQAGLAKIDNDMALMNALANDLTGTSTLMAFLLETTRAAYGLTGAVDADHRELATIEDDVRRTVVRIERLLNGISRDINRQIAYIGSERSNLTALSLGIKSGQPVGGSLAGRMGTVAPQSASARPFSSPAGAAAAATKVRKPLVVIRFDRPNVTYEQELYMAVSQALERRPSVLFDLVAVAPANGTPAQVTLASTASKRRAETVLRALTDMGLPMDRVSLSATTSSAAKTNEVHLYVR